MIKRLVLSLVPGLISFGPLFIAMSGMTPRMPLPIVGYGGALGLSLGLVVMFWKIQNLQSDLDRLKGELVERSERDIG